MTGRGRASRGPQFIRYFGPVLDALRALGESGTPDEVIERIATDLKLSDEIQNEQLPQGGGRFRNQVHWARFYLTKGGYLDASRRGVWSLTDKGRKAHISPTDSIQLFQGLARIIQSERGAKGQESGDQVSESTIESSVPERDHASQVLNVIQELSANGFERLTQRLLREAGFTHVDVTGRSGDGGIDGSGTLQLNPLVSFKVLFQCKKYRGSVSAPQIRDFRGAMAGRADKGLVITTGSFTADARREASRDGVPPIELIDGAKLVKMLENLELGLKPVQTYEVDLSFFDEFRN